MFVSLRSASDSTSSRLKYSLDRFGVSLSCTEVDVQRLPTLLFQSAPVAVLSQLLDHDEGCEVSLRMLRTEDLLRLSRGSSPAEEWPSIFLSMNFSLALPLNRGSVSACRSLSRVTVATPPVEIAASSISLREVRIVLYSRYTREVRSHCARRVMHCIRMINLCCFSVLGDSTQKVSNKANRYLIGCSNPQLVDCKKRARLDQRRSVSQRMRDATTDTTRAVREYLRGHTLIASQ